MKSLKVYPVLLAGGSGTRLWPTSRKDYPKQFSELTDKLSLFQKTALRIKDTKHISFHNPIIVTNNEFRFIVSEQLQAVGVKPGLILIEPEPRNTSPAILAAVEHLRANEPGALILVMPSDHLISDQTAFLDCAATGTELALMGDLVTFAIEPSHPETGYGYLKCSFAPHSNVAAVDAFVEKPNLDSAKKYIKSGNYFWNSGIFLFRARDLHDAVERHFPSLLKPVINALKNSEVDLDFLRLSAKDWSLCPDISIDYSVMERAENLQAVRFSGTWTDLGGWDAIWEAGQPTKDGITCQGPVTSIECRNSLLRSESANLHLVGLGLDNIVAVATDDAVLVANKDRSQDVKIVVSELRQQGVFQADTSSKEHRPWGWFESLAIGDRFQVKRIYVNPGAALSLQSHHHRSEHWIVVEGTARVTVRNKVMLITEGQSIYVPLGAKHRLENPGKLPMILVEVQTGSYLGEDDIVRYEDIYQRN